MPPQGFLSPEALERRERYGIAVDESDYPISPAYLEAIGSCGARIVTVGKWFATVVVESPDSAVASRIGQLPIVKEVRWIWKGEREPVLIRTSDSASILRPTCLPNESSPYGYADRQIAMLNGKALHEKGFRGQGMRIGVVDAGFRDVDRMSAFASTRIAGAFNLVTPAESVFADDDHGVKVLSCMAADIPQVMVGTAPEATYWLFKTEDNFSEFPIEEDYWVAAVETADSLGLDIVSSSLGYHAFDAEELNYSYSMLNGRSTLISLAAEKAASKGMLLFVSAGNEANEDWGTIACPADAHDVLTVGSITENKERSTFSAWGTTADRRIKPDVVALGSNCAVINIEGDLAFSSGTSFSTPIVAGLGACLWQAAPHLTNREIIALIIRSSSLYEKTDTMLGHGVPNFKKALKHSTYAKRTRSFHAH
ncbi:MAG: S8 family serine peptidase [Tannerellaceae bacterium]|nr:S8 family serine peptidase [Tannerellaceae bacterium]